MLTVVITALAAGAVTAFAQGMAGHLGAQAVTAFEDLRRAIWGRLSHDKRAKSVVAAVERNPNDDRARQELARVLAHYAAVDPHFAAYLERSVRHIQYFDNSNRGNWSVGRDNRGIIYSPMDDHRIYQSGGNRAGRDINVDKRRVNLGLDPIRSASGIPKVIMVLGMLIAFVGFAVFLSGLAEGLMTPYGASSSPPDDSAVWQRAVIGFGIAFVGAVVVFIGSVFRPKDR